MSGRHRVVKRTHLFLVALVILINITSYLLYAELRQAQEKTFSQHIDSIVLSLSRLGGHFIVAFDWPLLETLVSQAVLDPAIESVQIEDGLSGRKYGELTDPNRKNHSYLTREIIRDGERIGRVNLVIDEQTLKQTLFRLRGLLWVSIAAMVLSLSGFLYIAIRRSYETKLILQANYDSLTGLANRHFFRNHLESAIKRAGRDGSILALLFIDMDHFKKVNDTLGHAAGDSLLIEAARRMSAGVRGNDLVVKVEQGGDFGTVARLGGDEFTVILEDLRRPLDAEIVAERLLKACSEPFSIKGHDLYLSASIGMSIYPDDAGNAETMMRNADAAMYGAKEEGRGVARFFRKEMNVFAQERLLLENDLRNGFSRGELELFYQPLFDSETNALLGAEALLRWRSPSRGVVPPDQFICLAEDTGLIIPIGDFVLRRACAEAVGWQRRSATPLYVAVNVSTLQFRQSNLVESVRNALRATSLSPECLKLEITESVLLEDTERTQSTIQTLHDLGVRFSIDDFGTGYSSLSYLRRFPFEYLKIDRSFISNVTNSASDASLVESIIAMARNLNLKVVAEGIETDEQFAFVRNAGCNVVQGFRLGRPMPADEFIGLMTVVADGERHRESYLCS